MASSVKNVGTGDNTFDTANPYDSTIRTTIDGVEWVIGPNMLISFADDSLATRIVSSVSTASVGLQRVMALDNRYKDNNSLKT